MRLDRTTVKRILSLLLALVAVLALVYVLLPGRSSFKSDYPDDTTTAPHPAPEETRRLTSTNSAGVQCPGTGLAAVDLAGNCRATPQATMGALEAVEK